MDYVYPAVFHANDDGSYTITFPDFPGCISEGKSLGNAIFMAQSALQEWIEYLLSKKEKIPPASVARKIILQAGEFTNLVRTEIRDNKAVKRTVSLPGWMDVKASETGLSLSKVLQDALSQRFL